MGGKLQSGAGGDLPRIWDEPGLRCVTRRTTRRLDCYARAKVLSCRGTPSNPDAWLGVKTLNVASQECRLYLFRLYGASVLSQKLADKVFPFRVAIPQPRQGRKIVAQGASPARRSPHSVRRLTDTPLPRGRERGQGGFAYPRLRSCEKIKNS